MANFALTNFKKKEVNDRNELEPPYLQTYEFSDRTL